MPKRGEYIERKLVDIMWRSGYGALRSPGSGASVHPSPDVLACIDGRLYAFQVKSTAGDRIKYTWDEIAQLAIFCEKFSAEPWLVAAFTKLAPGELFFIRATEIPERRGKTFSVKLDEARRSWMKLRDFLNMASGRVPPLPLKASSS